MSPKTFYEIIHGFPRQHPSRQDQLEEPLPMSGIGRIIHQYFNGDRISLIRLFTVISDLPRDAYLVARFSNGSESSDV